MHGKCFTHGAISLAPLSSLFLNIQFRRAKYIYSFIWGDGNYLVSSAIHPSSPWDCFISMIAVLWMFYVLVLLLTCPTYQHALGPHQHCLPSQDVYIPLEVYAVYLLFIHRSMWTHCLHLLVTVNKAAILVPFEPISSISLSLHVPFPMAPPQCLVTGLVHPSGLFSGPLWLPVLFGVAGPSLFLKPFLPWPPRSFPFFFLYPQ